MWAVFSKCVDIYNYLVNQVYVGIVNTYNNAIAVYTYITGTLATNISAIKTVVDANSIKLNNRRGTPGIHPALINSSSYVTLLSVSGSGFLKSISVIQYLSTAFAGYVTITIDGVVICTDFRVANSNGSADNCSSSVPLDLRYNSSLLIQGKTTGNVTFTIVYTTD